MRKVLGAGQALPTVSAVAFSLDGTLLYSATAKDKHVLEWNIATGDIVRKLK